MANLSVRAYEAEGNRSAQLILLEAEVSAYLESPALDLSARFLCDAPPGEIGEAEAFLGDTCVFRGHVDKQRTSLTEMGLQVRLEARSPGALLLDNEAQPHSYADVSLETVFNRHIAPYGFSWVGNLPATRLPLYTVSKGTVEWEALTGWLARATGGTAYVNGYLVSDRPWSSGILGVSNRGGGVPFTELTLDYLPYHVISQIYLRDEQGMYLSQVDNPEAIRRRIRRKRYLIPSSEFEDGGLPDADRRIRRSMDDFLSAAVTIPELVAVSPGDNAVIREPGFDRYLLEVRRRVYKTGASGSFTRLELGNAL